LTSPDPSPHPGETGRARENVIAKYLRRIVPKEFGIDTGFVFDASGSISRQVDVVIYRTGYHPVFEIGEVKHFIVESVVAVLENKASIAKRDRLDDALGNIRSVKALDRTNAGTNYIVTGGQQGAMVDAGAFEHQIFGAIVTERSLSNETLQDALRAFFRQDPNRNLWPNMYADVRGVVAGYCKPGINQGPQITAIPAESDAIYITDTAKPGPPALIQLTQELINFLRIAPVVDFQPTAYFGPGVGNICRWNL
jgi:hypothetical protein